MPSYVAFTDEGVLIGEDAKSQLAQNADRTLFGMKRLLGRSWSDSEVQANLDDLPYNVVNHEDKPCIRVQVQGKEKIISPEEVTSMLIGKLKSTAETFLDEEVTHAVAAVPAYFNDSQRQALKDAGEMAGLQILRIVNEPTAAAIAYGLDMTSDDRSIIVYDLGGTELDISLLTVEDGIFEILATGGPIYLGGDTINQQIIEYLLKQFHEKNPDVAIDSQTMAKIDGEVERGKRELSSREVYQVEVKAVREGLNFSQTLTRAKLEDLNAAIFEATIAPLREILVGPVDDILAVGGSSNTPKVGVLFTGPHISSGMLMILKVLEHVEQYFGRPVSKGVQPSEATVIGAAIQASILSVEYDEGCILYVEIAQLPIGIETTGGLMRRMIMRNTMLPTSPSQTFSTTTTNQSSILVKVYEGERATTNDSIQLASFELTGIPPAPAGGPEIQVRFKLDLKGLLKVTALDLAAGKKEGIDNIQTSYGRGDKEEDIDNILLSAEEHGEEDQALYRHMNERNRLDTYIRAIDGYLKDYEWTQWRGSVDQRERILDAVRETRELLKENYHIAPTEAFLERENTLLNFFGNRVLEGYVEAWSIDGRIEASSKIQLGDHDELWIVVSHLRRLEHWNTRFWAAALLSNPGRGSSNSV
ncbi:Uu.00g074920.m01.CDS01 [Anthostomella pinea]|uniref:Uu.00g074920.m01.CDS01 n=1 Tax=Anthostomella pinea TaxID=933095 RepID=A0AAI8YLP5_9PEZI|nr:Uu.00g074920.m01.CDS01 [Anthostomella pinea]